MIKSSKLFLMIITIMSIVLVFTPKCYGNSGEPPSILIIVTNEPDDLEISIGSDGTEMKASKTNKAFESYYIFYKDDLKAANDYTLKIRTEANTFELH